MQSTFPLTIGFFAGGSVAFTGVTAAEQDLGGSEYACVKMAEALADRGHSVTVYTPYSESAYPQGVTTVRHAGVTYVSMHYWLKTMRFKSWDLFIVSRDYAALTHSALQAKQLVLWNHDVLTNVDSFLEHIYPVDRIYCLSEWQKAQYLAKINERGRGEIVMRPEQITVTRNGIDTKGLAEALKGPLLKGKPSYGAWWQEEEKYSQPTFLYASRPERGLLYLLRDIWPHVLHHLPDAMLHVACYDVQQELLPEMVKQIHAQCHRLMSKMPNVRFLGHLPRYKLYREMASCHALLYPCIFPEISCLTALEAQACGTPVLSSDYAALFESNLNSYHHIFDREKLLLQDETHAKDAAEHIANFIKSYDRANRREDRKRYQERVLMHYPWSTIAYEWEQHAYEHFERRSQAKPTRIIENLIYHSDLLAAQHALDQYFADPDRDGFVSEMRDLDSQVRSFLEHHHDEPEQYGEFIDIGEAEDITVCPERMTIALDLIEERLGKDTPFTLLDVGCGTGRFLYHVITRFPKAQVMGMDFSQKCLDRADANLRRLLPDRFPADELGIASFLVQGDFLQCEPPPLEERPDVVFAGEWLEHQVELKEALEHANAWCKPGGLVIYTVPNGPWEALSYGQAFTKDGHEIRFHVSHFEERDLMEMFANATDLTYQYAYIQRSAIDNAPIGQFVVAYTAQEGMEFQTPNYTRKFLTTRPRPKIGAALIAKNEEHCILRALRQLDKRMDVIYVGDTGSTDRTVELAKKYATVIDIGWYRETGFSGARNTIRELMCDAHDLDWIYWMDADEELIDAHALRKYLSGDLNVFEAYVIFQHHLMLDIENSRDVPMRVFRNKPHYQWFGLIHEQIMDMQRDPTGNYVMEPALIIPDVQIAHFGYTTDSDRRRKVLDRNLPLLKLDRELYPNRELGKICIMRDLCNTVRWYLEKGADSLPQYYVEMLLEVVNLYQEFRSREHQNHTVAHVMYQDALRHLGMFQVPVNGRVPIQASILLMAETGGLPKQSRDISPQNAWFLTPEDLTEYMTAELHVLTARLGNVIDPFAL